ncbi:LOW QUALITY PROTEIN: bromodomain-containing protein 8-like [Melanotaenia boesemani]|uniref:LOW QUALITY PROTEIN: bromodomain-containing protein 8-like n=1 Tax=Melanotaenia boesemani TaxID=1250792 RepID=UPI001C03F10A|nr:LOW QUALITY PROTEIN: bromodomain-containing protein 8-like [Melanotaenia boesemani]
MECRDDRKMANGVGKHKLLVIGPTEPWSVREKLCLATSVMKSGDQNWVSVSRAIKPFAEPGRPPDWFSQKHCASKYSELLETTEAPKRKRGEKGDVVETVEDVIVRRLTAERIEELKRLIKETQEKHRKLKKEAELIQTGHLDSKLEELWEEILQKKKLEEEEAELKKKTTEAAYQARQVAKSTPKRMSSITMRSPSACSSPSQEFSPDDPLECLTMDLASTKASGTARLMTFVEPCGPGNDDSSPGALLEDPTQKKFLNQKVTPPPSPLLSELLKKGSILATNSRLIGEGDVSTGNVTGAHELQLPSACQPLSQATGAPMLSRLLEAGPTQFSPPLGFMVITDSASGVPLSAATPVSLESTETASTEVDETVPSVPPGCQPLSTDEKVSEVSEEDVTVSYMGDELDLKTVGDIIAIIEEKADEAAEALDAAAVEAALSLCEENGHALSEAWDTGPFQPHETDHRVPTVASQTSSLQPSLDGGAEASLSSLYSSHDTSLTVFPMDLRSLPPTSSSLCHSNTLDHCHNSTPPQPQALRQTGVMEDLKKQTSNDGTIKSEKDKKAQQRPKKSYEDSVLEDIPQTERQPEETKVKSGTSGKGGKNTLETRAEEIIGSEVCGEEEGDGVEEFLSEPDGEMELEPAASESEDGYSLHTASSSLQLHTTADSIPSSPASSQFSVCSEDLEALQAHKIWKKAIMLVWRAAANHRYANVFLQPVTDEIAPGYHSIVHRPMDLATIKKNIETGLIRTTAEFQRDIMLMFQNAVMYNGLDHDVYHMALEMQRDVMEQIQQFLATQLIMETSESGISAKSLRGRESTRKQDSTDKDTVSMSSPAFLLSLFDGGTRGRRSAMEADLKMKK